MTSSVFELLAANLDRRLGLQRPTRRVANKIFPDHWSFLLGEVAMFAFLVLIATGIFLAMFYRPSVEPVLYTGNAAVYAGQELPAAYESVVRLTHDVTAGELFRRIHRSAAHVLLAAVVLHLARIVLTGAFRRPREVNYLVGTVLLTLAIGAGYTGQNLVYDVIAGTSLRITYSFLASIPWVGPQVAFWVFGGEFPTGDAIPRFFVLHVLILPATIATLVAIHLAFVVRQRHTQLPYEGVDGDRTVVGSPLWPSQFATSTTMMLLVAGTLAVFAVLVPTSRIALHGPYRVGEATNAAQPDWFLMWIEGALRVAPAFEWSVAATTLSQLFVVGILLPTVAGIALVAYPFVERRLLGDGGDHHVLQHPFDVPARAAIVAAAATAFVVLTAAATNDVISRLTRIPVERVIWFFRVAALVLPLAVGFAVYRYARSQPRRWVDPASEP